MRRTLFVEQDWTNRLQSQSITDVLEQKKMEQRLLVMLSSVALLIYFFRIK